MDIGTRVTKTNPVKQANIINRLFFWWTMPLFWKGAKKDLLVTDLYAPVTSNKSKELGDALQRYSTIFSAIIHSRDYLFFNDSVV
ncbi:multidrug resistance-associated protein 4 [Cephus cinctus]|uniref:Multidrug resistance-associated protein 4 n=1 Tax=Cephus cinctus TaxID=211228 RepID=A0AAJ7FIT6_CEPCN|nr:multidrug resistance-associated protein 4 [Cephus cinctus]